MHMSEMESWSWPPRYDDNYRPDPRSRYWFTKRETMDPGERERAILGRLREICDYAYANAPFYRAKWDDAGFHPDQITSLEAFETTCPVIAKADLRKAQERKPPFGDYLCVPESEIFHIHGTSGTTGRPTAFAIGRDDWRNIANAHARIMWGMGIRPTDTVFVAAILSLYMGSWGALSGVERLFFSGEPGASVPGVRDRIESAFNGKVFDCGSMAEMSPFMNVAGSEQTTGMLCWQDVIYTEVCDPATYTRVPYGERGTPVYTHLERTSQPMIRLVSGDLTRWTNDANPCGRTYPRLPDGIFGRIDDMFTIRGENVYPSEIDAALNELPHYGGEHRILISREATMDELLLRVEAD